MIIATVVGLAAGLVLGFALNITYPTEYSFYITMALLAALDSILGAVRSQLESKYNNLIFISGFITNAVLAGLLAYLGDRLGVPLYYAAILVFGGRLFNNLAVIRRIIIDKYFINKTAKKSVKKRGVRLPELEEGTIYEEILSQEKEPEEIVSETTSAQGDALTEKTAETAGIEEKEVVKNNESGDKK